MAAAGWYHCSVKPVSRSTGRSAVAAAAYRLGDRLHDEALDQTHDYTRRSGVVTTFTLAPEGAPDWALEPEALWNAAEAAENRRNSQVAREYELALPSAVSSREREAIARGFAQHLVDRYGVAVTGAIHEPSRHGDDRNFHAHILTTTRRIEADGLGKKTRILDDRKTGPQEILYLRGYAAGLINDALERAGAEERVDHRSLEARGIDREATEHLGPTASEMERRGEETERGSRNREIQQGNQTLDELVTDLAGVEAEIVAEEERRLNDRFGSPAHAADPGPGLWQSLKQAARSVFGLAQAPAAPESPEPLPENDKRAERGPFADGAEHQAAPDLSAAPATPGLWESFKLAARSVFGLAPPTAAPRSPELSTADEKRAARDPFIDAAEQEQQPGGGYVARDPALDPSVASASPGLWQSLKQAARNVFGVAQPLAAAEAPEPPAIDDWRAARDPFMDVATAEVAEIQLRAGEIPQGGLGMPSWQRTAAFTAPLPEHAPEPARNRWETYVERRGEAIDNDIDPGRDDGPDLMR